MKTFFLFHDDPTQWVKADIAASLYPFDGFVVIEKTRPWWGKYLWKRSRRLGFIKVIDELIYRLYYKVFQAAKDRAMLDDFLTNQKATISKNFRRPPIHRIHDINSDEARILLEDELKPDVCVLMVNVILKRRIFSIPTFGMLAFHPGIVPEYRGCHSAFWAARDRRLWGIGWSLLRIDAGVDTGEVLDQGTLRDADPLTESHIVIQHKAHFAGLPQVANVLEKLSAGISPTIPLKGRIGADFTHPGFTDFLKYRNVIRQLRSEESTADCWNRPF